MAQTHITYTHACKLGRHVSSSECVLSHLTFAESLQSRGDTSDIKAMRIWLCATFSVYLYIERRIQSTPYTCALPNRLGKTKSTNEITEIYIHIYIHICLTTNSVRVNISQSRVIASGWRAATAFTTYSLAAFVFTYIYIRCEAVSILITIKVGNYRCHKSTISACMWMRI